MMDYAYWPEDKNPTLSFLVKAKSADEALAAAGPYTVQSVGKCRMGMMPPGVRSADDKMKDVWRVVVQFEPAELSGIFGRPGKGVSIEEAYRRVELAQKATEDADKDEDMKEKE